MPRNELKPSSAAWVLNLTAETIRAGCVQDHIQKTLGSFHGHFKGSGLLRVFTRALASAHSRTRSLSNYTPFNKLQQLALLLLASKSQYRAIKAGLLV